MPGSAPLVLTTKALPRILLGVLIAPVCAALIAVHHDSASVVIAVAIVALYVWFLVHASKRRLTLDADGITDTGWFSATTIPWAEVDHYTFVSMGQRYAGAAGAGGLVGVLIASAIAGAMDRGGPNRRFRMGTLAIRSRDGRTLKLRPQWRDIGAALDRVFGELHPRLAAPSPDRFAPLALTPTGIVHPRKGELALPDIDRVDVHNGMINLRKRGKRFAWHSFGMRRIRNSMLFLEQLAERGIVVKTSADLFVPDPVMAKLSATNARAEALPRASVVQR